MLGNRYSRRNKPSFISHSLLEEVIPWKPKSNRVEVDDSELNFEDFKPYLSMLPDKEVDLLEMTLVYKKSQKEVAAFFEVTQGAISHRLSRAKERLKLIKDMPHVADTVLLSVLRENFEKLDAEICFLMVKSTCQAYVAKQLNQVHGYVGDAELTQARVRQKFHKCIINLGKHKLKLEAPFSASAEQIPNTQEGKVFLLLKYVAENPYMLYEVPLPHFDRGSDVFITSNI